MSSHSKRSTPEHTPGSQNPQDQKKKADEPTSATVEKPSKPSQETLDELMASPKSSTALAVKETNNASSPPEDTNRRPSEISMHSLDTPGFGPPKLDPYGYYAQAYNSHLGIENREPLAGKNRGSHIPVTGEALPDPFAINRRPLPPKSRGGAKIRGNVGYAGPAQVPLTLKPYVREEYDNYDSAPRGRPVAGRNNAPYYSNNYGAPLSPLITDPSFGVAYEPLSHPSGSRVQYKTTISSFSTNGGPVRSTKPCVMGPVYTSFGGTDIEDPNYGGVERMVGPVSSVEMDALDTHHSQIGRKSNDTYVARSGGGNMQAIVEDIAEDNGNDSGIFVAPKRSRPPQHSRGLGGGRGTRETCQDEPISLRQGKKPFSAEDYSRLDLPEDDTPPQSIAAGTRKRPHPHDDDQYDGRSQSPTPGRRPPQFNNPGRNLRVSRYAGAENEWNLNQDPPMVPQEDVTDAALLKRGLQRGNGDRVCKRGYGANDPENISIVNMRESEQMTFEQIKDELNKRRVDEGREPTLTTTGVTGRYNRTAPLLFAAQGEVFVPLSKRGGKNKSNPGGPNGKITWTDDLDVKLVQSVQEIDAQKWDSVAELFTQKTGKKINRHQAAQRHGML